MTTELPQAWRATPAPATDADRAAIEACVLDYFEGWFEADPGRIARALHPLLVKRSYRQDPDRLPVLDTVSAEAMVEFTRRGGGRDLVGGRPSAVEIADAGNGIASVIVRSEHYHEYLHLVETPAGWRIVNVMWRWSDGHGPRD